MSRLPSNFGWIDQAVVQQVTIRTDPKKAAIETSFMEVLAGNMWDNPNYEAKLYETGGQ